MMIESARRLIAGERDVDGPELPSAHAVSLGQSVSGSYFRFLLTPKTEERLEAIESDQAIEIDIAEKYHWETFTVTVAEIDGVANARAWPAGSVALPPRAYPLIATPARSHTPCTLHLIWLRVPVCDPYHASSLAIAAASTRKRNVSQGNYIAISIA